MSESKQEEIKKESTPISDGTLTLTIIANDIAKQLKEQNKILRSIDKSLDKLVRKPIK